MIVLDIQIEKRSTVEKPLFGLEFGLLPAVVEFQLRGLAQAEVEEVARVGGVVELEILAGLGILQPSAEAVPKERRDLDTRQTLRECRQRQPHHHQRNSQDPATAHSALCPHCVYGHASAATAQRLSSM